MRLRGGGGGGGGGVRAHFRVLRGDFEPLGLLEEEPEIAAPDAHVQEAKDLQEVRKS